MKKIALVLVVLMAASSLAFAGGGGQQSGGGASGSGQIQIALLMRNMNEQFLKDYAENVRKLAVEKGVALNVQDANNDMQAQLTQLDTLLNQGYKYFVVIPIDGQMSEQMNRAIAERGGAAAYSNTPPTTEALKVGKTFFFASSPELIAGKFAGQIVADYFDKNPDKAPGKVVNMIHIQGALGHPAQVNRQKGMEDELKARGYSVVKIAEDTANWTPDQAQEKMSTWIGAHRGRFNVVVAQNDGMALGAIEAMIQNGLTKDDAADGTSLAVPVIGYDATQEALNSMSQDRLYATVLQDSKAQSDVAFGIVYELASTGSVLGKTISGLAPANAVTPEYPANDAAVIQQCYLVPYVPITKDNYRSLLK
ncbi:MAG: substrate-binding domain-containing protein [Treponema sp.]|jgi:ABC-type sugar transport system substrate-binding protein|nr:substrate-binding domain-containing protein [Treponema sp.]